MVNNVNYQITYEQNPTQQDIQTLNDGIIEMDFLEINNSQIIIHILISRIEFYCRNFSRFQILLNEYQHRNDQ